jgi:hypothetical protein
MKPFTLTSPWQFRAYGPPDLTSARYARDLEAVRSLGAKQSSERTADETEIAMFHTENPTTFWARNLRDLALVKGLNTADSARLFAMAFVGFGDAAIACWDSKYYFNRWRPVTAIVNADLDGNDATSGDPAWLPLANTPPHPEYPAAHGCVSAEIADTLRRFFGTRHLEITLTSTVPGSVPHVFYRTDDVVEEVKMARVWGGMHYPTSTVHGARIGYQVAEWIGEHYFQRVRHRD